MNFSDGLASIQAKGKCGYINKTGKMVIKEQFDNASDFSEGLTRVELSGKWGYINKKGEIVIHPQFEEGRFFHEGRAAIRHLISPAQ